MKTLIVGDIHGKVEVVEKALAQEHPVIFLGDIADSFDRKLIHHLKCFSLIFNAINDGKARCIYGNHELSYIEPRMRCSGYNPVMQTHMDGSIKQEMEKLFEHFIWFKPNILISHAGLTYPLYDIHNLELDTLKDRLDEWEDDIKSPMYAIGQSRGGLSKHGGMFWCDWSEFEPVPGLIQIVGHTRGKEMRQKEQSFCIDYNDFQSEFFYMDL